MAGRVHPATAEQIVRLAQGQPPPRASERMSEAEVQAVGGTAVIDSWAGRVYEVRQVAGSVLPVKAHFRFDGPPADYSPTVAEADAVKAGYRLTVNDHQGRVYEKPTGEWLLYDYAPPRPTHMTEAQAQGFGYRLTEETAGERVYTKGADTARYAKAGYDPAQMNADVRQFLGLGGPGAAPQKPRAGYRPSDRMKIQKARHTP